MRPRRPWGGVLACNLAGPRRIKAARGARSFSSVFAASAAAGKIFKAGGKVVKNVTGYDLPKLMAGSYGTLTALEEVTVKVLPRPENVVTVLFAGVAPEAASRLMSAALGSPHEVSARPICHPARRCRWPCSPARHRRIAGRGAGALGRLSP